MKRIIMSNKTFFSNFQKVFILIALHYAFTGKANYLKTSNGPSVPVVQSGQFNFTENKGQLRNDKGAEASEVLFYGRLNDANIYFTKNSIVYDFVVWDENTPENSAINFLHSANAKSVKTTTGKHYRVDMEFLNSNPASIITGTRQDEGYNNYYIGNNQKDWKLGVKMFTEIKYQNIYPGVDLIIRSNPYGGGIKYDMVVKAGADISQIKYKYNGASSTRINANNELIVENPLGKILEAAPVSYQYINGSKVPVGSRFLINNNLIGFDASAYQKNHPLIIDPSVMVWGTFYGGSGTKDQSNHLVMDSNGDLVMVGETNSSDFPTTPGSMQTISGGNKEAFVVKFNQSGSRIWSTYLGGSGDDEIRSCATDKAGNIFYTGTSRSLNLPLKDLGGGAYYNPTNTPTFSNFNNFSAVLGKISPSGGMLWSTYFGGDIAQSGIDVFVDRFDNLLISGYTASSETKNFPLKNADQAVYGGPPTGTGIFGDIYIGKFNNSGIQQWTTYLGGPQDELGFGIASDSAGNVYICGDVNGSGINHISPYQSSYAGGTRDVVLAKYDKDGKRIWSTYFGGSALDMSRDLIFYNNFLYVTGVSSSTNLPGPSTGVVQPNNSGGLADGFLLKFSPDANANQVIWRTYNGGTGDDGEDEIAIDNSGKILIGGYTNSANFPTFPNSYQTVLGGGYDGHVTTLNEKGERLCATFFGGKFRDNVYGLAAATNGDIFITGNTGNKTADGFKTTSGAFQQEKNGNSDNDILDTYLARITEIPDKPKATFTASPNSSCTVPLKVKLTNNSTFNNTCYWLTTWDWSFPGADITSSKDQNPPDITYNAPGEYTIKLTVTNKGGTDILEQKVIISSQLKLSITPDQKICSGDSVKLVASGADEYTWTPATGLNSTTSGTVWAKPNLSTTYVVNGKKASCPVTPASVKVSIDSIDAKLEASIIDGSPVPYQLKATDKSINGQTCSWKLISSEGEKTFPNVSDLSATIDKSGFYTLKLICQNNTGCQDSDSISFTLIDGNVSLIIPNVFSPGATDTINNLFKFQMTGVKKLNGIIFDRWGKEVYSWSDNDFWDGTIDGKDAPDGVYFFIVEATNFKDEPVNKEKPEAKFPGTDDYLPYPIKGSVTLIRDK